MSKIYNQTGGIRPGRSVFDLSYEKKFDCDMGQLIPVMCDEVVPGDIFKIGNEIVIRFQPLVAPILHEINAFVHYFFVPYRILDEDFEEFITGGVDGASAVTLPRWEPTNTAIGSLWDYFGFPTGVNPVGAYPLQYPLNAYNTIWNEYYRDQNLQAEVAIDQETILLRAWEKDYFTSSLPFQQRGTAPAMPVTIVGADRDVKVYSEIDATARKLQAVASSHGTMPTAIVASNYAAATSDIRWSDPALESVTFDVADLRLAFQIQKWMERNARAGVRYTEFLRSHFGVSPRDERLDRPEYIGGSRSPVNVSEVLKTSSTDATSPQGNLAGHGLTADQNFIASYHVQEYGLIIGIMSVMPRSAYQQGIDRQWLRRTRYDFYFPEFANLSEQAVETAEIYATGVSAENRTIFGYQGRYNEMRKKQSQVCGNLRDTLDFWHLGRQFASSPLLNASFIQCVPRKDVFAVTNKPGLVVNIGNNIKAIRPLPYISEPGLIDHN
nr:MAG: major capsid protein [Microvirus sp.]